MLAAPEMFDLRRVLERHAERLPYLYLESETRVLLVRLTDYLAGKLPDVRWQVGRAFGPDLEMRWRRDDLSLEAQWLCEDESAPPGWTPSDWNVRLDATAQARNVLLAGVNTLTLPPDHALANAAPNGGLWLSDSIGAPLRYPVSDPRAERVVLRCLDYTVGGIVVLTRLCDVATYAGGANPQPFLVDP